MVARKESRITITDRNEKEIIALVQDYFKSYHFKKEECYLRNEYSFYDDNLNSYLIDYTSSGRLTIISKRNSRYRKLFQFSSITFNALAILCLFFLDLRNNVSYFLWTFGGIFHVFSSPPKFLDKGLKKMIDEHDELVAFIDAKDIDKTN